MDKYSAHAISQISKKRGNCAVIAAKTQNINTMKAMYNTPIGVVLLTYMEILPLGLIVTIITALILKRKASMAV